MSSFFHTVNGVRQGGVLSPILFTLYIDVLLQRLQNCGAGCMVGCEYFGVLCYADDITLLSPTVLGLQKMLQICEQFGGEYNIKYNPKKTVCICFHAKPIQMDNIGVALYGKRLPWSNSAKHLGNIVRADLKDDDDIQLKKCDFIGRTNSLIANFKDAPRSVCSEVFNSQCCHLYGTDTWNPTCKKVENFCVTWRKAVRKLWNLPNNARSAILPYLAGSDNMENQLRTRARRLRAAVTNSNNDSLKALLFMGSYFQPEMASPQFDEHDQTVSNRADLVKELTKSLENELEIKGFDYNELKELINFICQF